MNDNELHEMYMNIKNKIAEVENSIAYLEELCRPIAPSVSLGRLTRMEALGEKGVNEALLAQNKTRLDKLKSASLRIIDGTYGTCLVCKNGISPGRLSAVPEAIICLSCKEKRG